MYAKELRQKSKEELSKLLHDNRKRLMDMRFDLVRGQLKNAREIRSTRKDIARILTLLKEEVSK